MTKISRKRRSRRFRSARRSASAQKYESVLSEIEETNHRVRTAHDKYLTAIADGLHNTLRLYWHSLSAAPIPRGRQTIVPFKPGRVTIKKMLADFPVSLTNRHSIAHALFEISVQGPHDPDLLDRIADLSKSLCLSYAK